MKKGKNKSKKRAQRNARQKNQNNRTKKSKRSKLAEDFWSGAGEWGKPAFIVESLMANWRPDAKAAMREEVNRILGMGDKMKAVYEHNRSTPDLEKEFIAAGYDALQRMKKYDTSVKSDVKPDKSDETKAKDENVDG